MASTDTGQDIQTATRKAMIKIAGGDLDTGAGGGGDASAANQTATQAIAGSDASKATAVQGITGGKAVKVDGSAVTQPVSGTVTANLGTLGGTKTSANSASVVLASDAIVPIVGTRLVELRGTFTPATSYATGQNIAGLLTMSTGLAAGTMVEVFNMQLTMVATALTAAGAIAVHTFNSNPSGSTFTDGSGETVVTADINKVVKSNSVAATSTGLSASGAIWPLYGSATSFRTTVDASGNLYVALVANATHTYTAPTAAWRLEVRY